MRSTNVDAMRHPLGAPVAERNHTRRTILIVDDDVAVHSTVASILHLFDYATIEITDGQDCIDYPGHDAVDAILLDLNMPNVDGTTVYRRLREAGVRTPVLLVTALPYSAEAQALLQEGVADIVPKPLDIDELITKIAELFR